MSYDAKPIYFMNPRLSTPEIKKEMETFLKSWLPKHSTSEDLILYHYTTLEGLKGIIRARSIWATHTSTLNDPTELNYGKELIIDVLNEAISGSNDDKITYILNQLLIYIKAYDSILYQTYVSCFCQSDNLLSQWRGYAAKGGGYNLGMNIQTDTKFFHTLDSSRKESYVILRKIIYDSDVQKKLIKDYISSIVTASGGAIKKFKKNGRKPAGWTSMAAIESINILIDLMLSFKNPVFKEESEWRLIKGHNVDITPEYLKFRDTNNNLVPYIETYIVEETSSEPVFPLKTFRFGPILDEASTKPSLELFVRKESVSKGNINIDTKNLTVLGAGYNLRS